MSPRLGAVLALAAGIALPQVLGPRSGTISPVGDRVVVASGETAERPRRLTTPRAVTESHTPAEASSFRCLDLDGPTMEDRSRPQTMQANYCIVGDERIEPSGGLGGVPGFAGTRTSCTARCRRRSAGYWGVWQLACRR